MLSYLDYVVLLNCLDERILRFNQRLQSAKDRATREGLHGDIGALHDLRAKLLNVANGDHKIVDGTFNVVETDREAVDEIVSRRFDERNRKAALERAGIQ